MPLPLIEPLAPRKIAAPVDHPGVVYELKHDGWRAHIKGRRVLFASRIGRGSTGIPEYQTVERLVIQRPRWKPQQPATSPL